MFTNCDVNPFKISQLCWLIIKTSSSRRLRTFLLELKLWDKMQLNFETSKLIVKKSSSTTLQRIGLLNFRNYFDFSSDLYAKVYCINVKVKLAKLGYSSIHIPQSKNLAFGAMKALLLKFSETQRSVLLLFQKEKHQIYGFKNSCLEQKLFIVVIFFICRKPK